MGTTWAEQYATASTNGERAVHAEAVSGQGLVVIHPPWPRLLTLELAAAYTGLAEQTIRNKDIELPGKKQWGRKVVYDRRELDRLIDGNNGSTDLWVDSLRAAQ